MIDSFTFETVGFNPTALIITIASALVISAIFFVLYVSSPPHSNRRDVFATLSIIIGVVGVFIGGLINLSVESSNVVSKNGENRVAAIHQTLDNAGYEDVTLNDTAWTASFDGQYVKGNVEDTGDNSGTVYQYGKTE